MIAFIGRRVLFLPVLCFGVTLLIYLLLAPLGPYQRLSLYVSTDPTKFTAKQTPEEMKRIIKTYGFDDPFYLQYGHWLGKVLKGDFGWSKTAQAPVTEALLQRLPATLELSLFAVLPMLLLAILAGVRSAARQNHWMDYGLRFVSILGISMPAFLVSVALLMVLYGFVPWFPPGRLSIWAEQIVLAPGYDRFTGMNTVDALLNGRVDIFLDALRHLTLPVVTLAIFSWAGLMRITRSAMLEALGQDYITAARAKGVSERRVVNRHALRNALIPITTHGVGMVIGLLGGAIFVESVYHYPGVGLWAAGAARDMDIPAVIGLTFFSATLVVLGNLAADLVYATLDPRIRYD